MPMSENVKSALAIAFWFVIVIIIFAVLGGLD